MPQKTVKILGYTVRAGSKKHQILLQHKKHFDDLSAHEPQGPATRKQNYPPNVKRWHTVADSGRGQSIAYTGSLQAATKAGEQLRSKGYGISLMPAPEDAATGWSKAWQRELKNPKGDLKPFVFTFQTAESGKRHTGIRWGTSLASAESQAKAALQRYGDKFISIRVPTADDYNSFGSQLPNPAPLGSGARFAALESKLAERPGVYDPKALAASIGRKKYGAAKMAAMAKAGKRKATRNADKAAVWSAARDIAHLHLTDAKVREIYKLNAKQLARAKELAKQIRRNPEEAAAELSELFHGRPAEEIEVVETEIQEHGVLMRMADLTEMKVATLTNLDATITFKKDIPALSSSEDGKQLYIEGGDQELDLEALKMNGEEWVKDSMVIGVLYEVTYQTSKRFDSFKLTDYWHTTGEENGVQPMLIYDPYNKLLSVSGGNYYIETKKLVQGMSPGIIN